jgi:hypothetical protein
LALVLTALPVQAFAGSNPNPWLHFGLGANGPSLGGTTLVYDPGTNQIIGFGGNDSACCNSENYVWLLSAANGIGTAAPQWVQESPAGAPPPPRSFASGVYDEVNSRMIVFGGGQPGEFIFNVLFNDVWVLSNANGAGGTPTWTQLNPLTTNGVPAPREGQMAIYDPGSNRMTIFGGGNNGIMDVPNDVWVLTNANGLGGQPEWIQLFPTGTLPAARENMAMSYDPIVNEMIVFGGCCPSFNDVWVLTNANGLGGTPAWKEVSPIGAPPAPRQNNGSFGYDVGTNYNPSSTGYNAGTNSMIIFGGLGYNPSATFYDDIWYLKNANNDVSASPSWNNPYINDLTGFPPLSTPLGTYDPISRRMMVLEDTSDLWILTTRNAIDLSCSAPGKAGLTTEVLTQIQQAGIQYVVVKSPQDSVSNCPPGVNGITRAREQLDAFSGSNLGFKVAAYCLLLFEQAGTGAAQAQNCLRTIEQGRYGTIEFLALDVEGVSSVSNADAAQIVTDAIGQLGVLGSGKQPVIYTFPNDWITIMGKADFTKYPLWVRLNSRFFDAANNEHCGDGIPSLGPIKFAGWSFLSGKQFDLGINGCSSTRLARIPVDFDVFDPSLFP